MLGRGHALLSFITTAVIGTVFGAMDAFEWTIYMTLIGVFCSYYVNNSLLSLSVTGWSWQDLSELAWSWLQLF